jgi:dipeptidyl aminopeptidase/acylaminoacyl peptidase
MRKQLLSILAALSIFAPLAAHAGRPLAPEDYYRMQELSDLQIAPDGTAVAYIATSYGKESDESRGALWLADWAGTQSLQLTRGESVSAARFSPDGRYLSFLSARPAEERTQLWLLDRRGGEPRQLTHTGAEITDYAWSADGERIVLVMRGDDVEGSQQKAKGAKPPPKPLVIDAYHFKEDKEGYLTAEWRSHLYLLDVRSGRIEALTADPARTDSLPVFSPDGRQIAYLSNQAVEQRDAGRDDICVVQAAAGAQPRRLLSTWSPNHQHLEWSPDGTLIALLLGEEPKYNAYILDRLAVAETSSGRLRDLTGKLDRAVTSPRFSADGRAIQFAVEDDGSEYPAQVSLASGAIERLAGPMVVDELATAAGHTAVLVATDQSLDEVYALEHGQLRPLSSQNHGLFAELSLASVEDIAFRSHDGTEIHGLILKPPDFVPGKRYPTILWIHGGPNGQDEHALAFGAPLARQLFATHGYVALAINYRGSTGRGAQFARSILADWGHKEVEDLLAGVDWAIARGIADPARLGIGGWSYGGILTDYSIASDARFRAAISGAGTGNELAGYGTDEYIVQDNAEIGPPWRNAALWTRISYPFLHADRIHTPALFLGGDADFNVPIAGGEQMYQALRTLGIPTQLVVYPDEHHTLTRPSFLVDRAQRYLDWMAKYLGQAR